MAGASQQSIDAWWQWATAVLHGIGAPATPTNYATLWNWSLKESGSDPMNNGSIHNNPLNTSQPAPGATTQNSSGVKSYPDVSTGAAATVQTLTNGDYPDIVYLLKQSAPTRLWASIGNAAAQLQIWATGKPNGNPGYLNWLNWTNQPPKPSVNFQEQPDPSLVTGSGGSNPVQDALNAALGPIGTAITTSTNTFFTKALYVFEIGVGALLMIGGLALLAALALKSPAGSAVGGVAKVASNATPVGRATSVASAAAPKPKPTPAPAPAQSRPNPEASTRQPGAPPRSGAEIAAARAAQRKAAR